MSAERLDRRGGAVSATSEFPSESKITNLWAVIEKKRNSLPDSRPLLFDLYNDRLDYENLVATAASELEQAGYILTEDVKYVITKAMGRWERAVGSVK